MRSFKFNSPTSKPLPMNTPKSYGKLSLFAAIPFLTTTILVLSFSSQTMAAFSTQSYPLATGNITESSPTLADITGDGVDEVLIGTLTKSPEGIAMGSFLIAMKGDGTILWKTAVDAPINSAPAVGDIDNDGDMEIIVSIGGHVSDTAHQGGIKAFDHLGNPLWFFQTLDSLPPEIPDGYSNGVYSSPTLCDVNSDGNLEIVFGAWDRNIYLLDNAGISLWNDLPTGYTGQGFHNADSSWSTAACIDLNSDGSREIVIGADITGGGIILDGTHTIDGGFLYIFDKNGAILVRRYLPEAIYSSPAVADLNNDGTAEIVVGTSWNFWYQNGGNPPPMVYAFDTSRTFGALAYSDPAKLPNLPGWPKATTHPGFSSPALADLDNDGDLEIVIGSGNPFTQDGQVHAWHHDGTSVPGWPVTPRNNFNNSNFHITSSPTIADIDGDNQLEVLFSMGWDIQVYNHNGTLQYILATDRTTAASPAIGDTNGDNKTDIWIGGGNNNEKSQGYLWKFSGSTETLGKTPWPMFHKDRMNSGAFPFYRPTPPGVANAKGALPATMLLMLH